jgi:hypothetical protein
MVNGKPGDHPLTDILSYGMLRPRLARWRDELRADARERGWEVDT